MSRRPPTGAIRMLARNGASTGEYVAARTPIRAGVKAPQLMEERTVSLPALFAQEAEDEGESPCHIHGLVLDQGRDPRQVAHQDDDVGLGLGHDRIAIQHPDREVRKARKVASGVPAYVWQRDAIVRVPPQSRVLPVHQRDRSVGVLWSRPQKCQS